MKKNRKITIFLCIIATFLFCLGASSCGNILNIAWDSHKMTEKKQAATCEEDGLITWTCEICGYEKTKVIEKLGHDTDCSRSRYSKKATCEEAAYCGDCGEYYGDSLGHDIYCYRNYDSKRATCTTKAYCGDCKKEYGPTPSGHDVNLTNAYSTKANCHKKAYCGFCGQEYGELDHDYQKVVVLKQQYCVEVGWETYEYCSVEGCTYTTYQELAPAGHDGRREGQTEFIEPSSRIISCVEEAYCGICRTEYIPSETHDIELKNWNSKAATCYEAAFCGICNNSYGTPLEHDLLLHEKKHPDCTNVGYIEYVECLREGCGYTTKQEIPALGHLKVDVLESDAECFEYGVKACNLCVYCEINELIESMHHRDEYKALSEYEMEQHKWECDICYKYWQYLKDPLGHDVNCERSQYSIRWNCLQIGYCGDCKQEYGEILGKHTKEKDADCTHGEYCSVCKQYYGEPLGHDVDCTRSKNSTKATCTKKGYCGVCKEYYLLDHEYKDGQCIMCKKEEPITIE